MPLVPVHHQFLVALQLFQEQPPLQSRARLLRVREGQLTAAGLGVGAKPGFP